MKLEELTPDTVVQGVVPGINVHVVRVDWHGSDTVTLSYRTPDGRMDAQILMRDDENRPTRPNCRVTPISLGRLSPKPITPFLGGSPCT